MSPTNGNDDLGNLIGRELRNRVDDLHDAPLTFSDVQGRADRIRRGRRIAAGVGVAAAAAILIPTALIAGSGLDRSQEPVPAPTGPSATATGSSQPDPTENPSGDPTQNETAFEPSPGAKPKVPLDVSDLETGEPPAVTWLDGRTAHLASGEKLELPAAYQSITEVGDRLVATGSDDQGNRQVSVLSEAGEPSGSFPVSDYSGVVSNGKGSAAAWIGPDGVPMVLQDGLDEPVAMSAVEGTGLGIGGLFGEDCRPDQNTGRGCLVYVNAGADAEQRTSRVVSSQGIVDRTRDGLLAVGAADADGSRLMAMTEVKDNGTCWEMTDRNFQTEWGTCRDRPEAFSADGQYVATIPADTEGYGPTELAVLRADDGDQVVRFTRDQSAQATPSQITWEDAEHLLAVVFQGEEWSVVRFGLDGSMEYAVPPRQGTDLDAPFVLPR